MPEQPTNSNNSEQGPIESLQSSARIGHDSLVEEARFALHLFGGWNDQSRQFLVAALHREGAPVSQLSELLRQAGSDSGTFDPPVRLPHPVNLLGNNPSQGVATVGEGTDLPDPEEGDDSKQGRTILIASLMVMLFAAIITVPVGWLVISHLTSPTPSIESGRVSTPLEHPGSGEQASGIKNPGRLPPAEVTEESPLIAELRESTAGLLTSAGLPADAVATWDKAMDRVRADWTGLTAAERSAAGDLARQLYFDKATTAVYSDILIAGIRGDRSSAPRTIEAAAGITRVVWVDALIRFLASQQGLPEPGRKALTRALAGNGGPMQGHGFTLDEVIFAETVRLAARLTDDLESGDPDAPARWRGWHRSLLAVSGGEKRASGVGAGIRAIVRGARQAPAERIAGVLSSIVSGVDCSRSAVIRSAVLESIDDPTATARGIATLTAYLVGSGKIPGADVGCVISENGSENDRRAARDRLASVWATQASTPTSAIRGVLGEQVKDWLVRAQSALNRTEPSEVTTATGEDAAAVELEAIVELAQLNRAAYFLDRGDEVSARRVLEDAPRQIALARGGISPFTSGKLETASRVRAAEGQPGMRDGQWSAEINHLITINDMGGAEESLNMLAAAARRNGEDLGEVDAAVLARLAVAGAPREIRILAQQVISTSYARGPVVLLALADTLPTERAESRLGRSVEEITGVALPAGHEPGWHARARGSLIDRVIALRGGDPVGGRLEATAELLAWVYDVSRPEIETGDPDEETGVDPTTAAERCAEVWRKSVGTLGPGATIPMPRSEIALRSQIRRSAAGDTIGTFAAIQQEILEIASLVTASQRKGIETSVKDLIHEVAVQQMRCKTALSQIRVAEEGMTRLWIMRLSQGTIVPTGPQDDRALPTFNSATHRIRGWTGQSAVLAQSWADLERRLSQLTAGDADAYFSIGEDALDLGATDIARHALVVAATDEPQRLGASACLALADAARTEGLIAEQRRMMVMAGMFSARNQGGPPIRFEDDARQADAAEAAAGLAGYRRGDGARSARFLQAALDSGTLPPALALGSETIESAIAKAKARPRCDECRNLLLIKCPACKGRDGEACSTCQSLRFIVCPECEGHPGPVLSRRSEDSLLRLEAALLRGSSASWAGQIAIDGNRPRGTTEPELLAVSLGVDATQTAWRDGQWKRR